MSEDSEVEQLCWEVWRVGNHKAPVGAAIVIPQPLLVARMVQQRPGGMPRDIRWDVRRTSDGHVRWAHQMGRQMGTSDGTSDGMSDGDIRWDTVSTRCFRVVCVVRSSDSIHFDEFIGNKLGMISP